MTKLKNKKKAFTMIELIFVVVIIGVLASIAVPRLSATRDDAEITKAKTVILAIRKSILAHTITGHVSNVTAVGDSQNVFGTFKSGAGYMETNVTVLPHPEVSQKKKYSWHWDGWSNGKYWYAFCLNDRCSSNSDAIWFMVKNQEFLCVDNPARHYGDCKILGMGSVPGW